MHKLVVLDNVLQLFCSELLEGVALKETLARVALGGLGLGLEYLQR
jgi:hypothetical protein